MVALNDTPVPVEDAVARSATLLEAVGFRLILLAASVAGVWDLLAVSPRGLTLIAAVTAPPNLMGHEFGLPPGWPAGTVRLILCWPPDAALPTPLTL
jgi:hypothetical protein